MMGLAGYGMRLLITALPTISDVNLWAAERGQPRPLISEPVGEMSRYSPLVPGRMWLHRSYRLNGWGYRFPASIQFKAEYSSGNSEVSNEVKTFRLPLF